MGDTPDFLFTVSARAYAAVPLALSVAVAGLIIAATAGVPMLRQDQWWVGAVAVGVPATLLFLGAWFGVAAVRGGVYRVEVRCGRLRVDSPSRRVFGPSFEVDLGAIKRLVVRLNGDWPDEYEVRTPACAFRVDSVCGAGLFDAIRRVRPDIPYERV